MIRLNNVIVGGMAVEFESSTATLSLAGDSFTLEKWQKLEKRINKFYERAGVLNRKNGQKDPNSGTSSFLTHNLRQILDRDMGIIQDPPFWLKGRYSGVITRERLWEL
jgi:hypothetical protein